MIGVLFAKFWPHALAGIALAALGATMTQCSSLSKENAVLASDMEAEKECVAGSHCRQAVTEYQRDTAQAATQKLTEAAGEVGKATLELRQRRAEIERESEAERARFQARLRAAERKLEEAMSNDPQCAAWLESPVPCPVPDAGRLLWEPSARRGIIDRSGRSADPEVRPDPGETDGTSVP